MPSVSASMNLPTLLPGINGIIPSSPVLNRKRLRPQARGLSHIVLSAVINSLKLPFSFVAGDVGFSFRIGTVDFLLNKQI